MLFVCKQCGYGYPSLNVESFKDCESGQTIYLCYKHIEHRTARMIHSPWLSQYDYNGCKICSKKDACYGLKHPNIIVHGTGKNFFISKK